MKARISRPALACVMGGMDLVRPLGLAGIGCAVVAPPGGPPLYSRFTKASICWGDPQDGPEDLLDALLTFGASQPERPVLYYIEDDQLLLVSRHRKQLAKLFRFVVAEPLLVEDLVDKGRFQILAERLRLPVPRTRRLEPSSASAPDLDLRFPIVIKPVTRRKPWEAIGGSRKALQVDDRAALEELWPRLRAADIDLLAQELVAGPETRIESYHVYVDAGGAIAGEFTGQKIRTHPASFGHSTALAITNEQDVMAAGRELVRTLRLRGVAKADFKRGPDGELFLLEINPRFSLWHHPGAVAGINLPALVYADLLGLPRPPVSPVRAGVRWSLVWRDLPAARAAGIPFAKWLWWTLGCEAKSAIAWDDPMPLLRGAATKLRSAGARGEGEPPYRPVKGGGRT